MKRFHNMNAYIHESNDGQVETLQSYDTLVCIIDRRGKIENGFKIADVKVTLLQNYRYSATTSRQVTRFINESLDECWTMRELANELKDARCPYTLVSGRNGKQVWYELVNVPEGAINFMHREGTPLHILV